MTRCALTPLIEVKHVFLKYGDSDPTIDVTRIAVTEKII